MKNVVWIGLMATLVLAGCVAQPMKSGGSVTDRSREKPHDSGGRVGIPLDEIRLVIQVCLPEKTVDFEDVEIELKGLADAKTIRERRAESGHPEPGKSFATAPVTEPQIDPDRVTVRRWIPGSGANPVKRSHLAFGDVLDQDGIRSAGSSGDLELWNNSESNQPIFETKGPRPEGTLALSVSTEVNGEISTFWYKPPKEIRKGQFTGWLAPISQEKRNERGRSGNPTFWNLTHDRPMEIYPVTEPAPKIRYRLATFEEYYDQYRFWTRAQKAVAEKFYRNVYGEERTQRHFAPRIMGVVPGC